VSSKYPNDPDQPVAQSMLPQDDEVTVMSVTEGTALRGVHLPMSPIDEYFSSPNERFQIALRALDSIIAERPEQGLSSPQLRGEIMHRTGLGWAPAALAINFRQSCAE
jgi:hypothetical protein